MSVGAKWWDLVRNEFQIMLILFNFYLFYSSVAGGEWMNLAQGTRLKDNTKKEDDGSVADRRED